MNFDNLNIRNKIFLCVGLVLALMIAMSLIVNSTLGSLRQTAGWVAHTEEVMGEGNKLVAEMVNMIRYHQQNPRSRIHSSTKNHQQRHTFQVPF